MIPLTRSEPDGPMSPMKTRCLTLLALCGSLMLSTASVTVSQTANSAPVFSVGVGEVVKLFQSGVDQTVILTYIKTSPAVFQPNADEIIRLHNLGIPSPMITAMLDRGGELRQHAPQPAAYAGYAQ